MEHAPMKGFFALLLLIPMTAYAGMPSIGEGFSDRNRVTIGYDYTFQSTTAWHLQANAGALIGLTVSPGPQGFIQDDLVRAHYDYTLYWGGSLLYQGPHAFISIGGIELNSPTPNLTSKYQFLDDIGLRFGAYRIMFRHISNGNTGGRNGGESMLYISADY
jgi:hypothetical protein